AGDVADDTAEIGSKRLQPDVGSSPDSGGIADIPQPRSLPSYQHFRPSMRRQDERCEFDGIAGLHCCFASAVGIPIVESAVQAATAIAESCFVISSSETTRCCSTQSYYRSRTFPRIRSLLWGKVI